MYIVYKSIDIDFAHHVSGHDGACINIHGHTWKFEVCAHAETLDDMGFVLDFKKLKTKVLQPVHELLDHSLVLSKETLCEELRDALRIVGKKLLATRKKEQYYDNMKVLRSALLAPGTYNGMRVVQFPFAPTSERIAYWFYLIAKDALEDERVKIKWTKIYETLYPVHAVAMYQP